MTVNPSRRIAEVLVDQRLITTDDLLIVQTEADAAGDDVLERLVSSGRVRRIDALGALAERLEVPLFDPATDFTPDPEAIGRLDAATAVAECALPISLRDDVMTVAVTDPLDAAKRQRLQAVAHTEVRLAISPESELVETVRRVYLAQPAATGFDPDAPTQIGLSPRMAPAEASYHINDLLSVLIDRGGSDLHMAAGSPPQMRLNGRLVPIEGYAPLRPAELRSMVYDILSARQKEQLEDKLELDASHPVAGQGRFRTNVFFQRGSVGVVMRAIPNRIASLEALGMPPVVAELAQKTRGLILITGATGSGKSTTLASMIDLINAQRSLHIMTVEDPIEFMHSHRNSIVNQREVGAPGDDVDGSYRCRDRAPGPGHFAHPRRSRLDRADHRCVPTVPTASGSGATRREPSGCGESAVASHGRRQRAGSGGRGHGGDAGHPQPHTRGQGPPDQERHAGWRQVRNADHGQGAGQPRSIRAGRYDAGE